MPASLSRRIIARLAHAEYCELNPHYLDDLRIARLTVAYARREAVLCSPHVMASYTVLGLHPEKVWPAILARRIALGGLVSDAPPKKPAQAVKLWCEKTNGARAINSRPAILSSGEPATSVPMAAPSINALYRNSDAPSSAKKREFSFDELLTIIEFSGAPHSVRQGTLSALKARGRWPHEDGPATGVICVSLIGMMFHGVCCRSTARWRARRACKLGFWRELRAANTWTDCPKCSEKRRTGVCEKCGHRGDAKNLNEFCRPFMYEIDVEKFRTAQRPREIRHFDARTYAEYKAAAKRGEHPNVTEMPSRKPAQPTPPEPTPAAAPVPVKQPAAESTRRITRDERTALFNTYIALKRTGLTHEASITEVCRQFQDRYSPEDIDFAVKLMGAKNSGEGHRSLREQRNAAEATVGTQGDFGPNAKCFTCGDSGVVFNTGVGPRTLPCPDCAQNSS